MDQILKTAIQPSNFHGPLKLLPASRYHAMLALYAFCRQIDDIADQPGPAEEKMRALDRLEEAINRRQSARLGNALIRAIDQYQLPESLFVDMIAAMRMDVEGRMCAPDEDTLQHYIYGAAETVGLLSIRIFGCKSEQAERSAREIAQILQRINIMRDIAEDAARSRLYLPKPWLEGIAYDDAALADYAAGQLNALYPAMQQLRADVQQRYHALQLPMSWIERLRLFPALLMLGYYWRIFRKLSCQSATGYRREVSLNGWDKCCGATQALRRLFMR